MGAFEGQLANLGLNLTLLSPEQLVECDNNLLTDVNRGDCSVFGGWPFVGMDYVQKHGGVRTWADFKYTGNQGSQTTVYPCMPAGYSKEYCGNHDDMYCNATTTQGQGPEQLCDPSKGRFYALVSGYTRLGADEKDMASSLVNGGPLSVCLDANLLQWYSSGVFNPPPAFCAEVNHAVLAVGFGSDNGTDYWTVKNSWSTNWGEQGYFRMVRGTASCGINSEVVIGYLKSN